MRRGLAVLFAVTVACGAERPSLRLEGDLAFVVLLDADGRLQGARRVGDERALISLDGGGQAVIVDLSEADFWPVGGLDLGALELVVGESPGGCGRCLAPVGAPPQPIQPGERCRLPSWATLLGYDGDGPEAVPLSEAAGQRIREQLWLTAPGDCAAASPPSSVEGGPWEQCVVWPSEAGFTPLAASDGPDGEVWVALPDQLVRSSSIGQVLERRSLGELRLVKAVAHADGGAFALSRVTGDGRPPRLWRVPLRAAPTPIDGVWPSGGRMEALATLDDGALLVTGAPPAAGFEVRPDPLIMRCEGGADDLRCVPETLDASCAGAAEPQSGIVRLPDGRRVTGTGQGYLAIRGSDGVWRCGAARSVPDVGGGTLSMDDVWPLVAIPTGLLACDNDQSDGKLVQFDAEGEAVRGWRVPLCDALWWEPMTGRALLRSGADLYALDLDRGSLSQLAAVVPPYARAPSGELLTASGRRVVVGMDGSASLFVEGEPRLISGPPEAGAGAVRALAVAADGRLVAFSDTHMVVLTPSAGHPCDGWPAERHPASWQGAPIAAVADRRSPDRVWLATRSDVGVSLHLVGLDGEHLEGGLEPALGTLRTGWLRELVPGQLLFLDERGLRSLRPGEVDAPVRLDGSTVLALPERRPELPPPGRPDWVSLEGKDGVVWVGGLGLLGRVLPRADGGARAEVFDWAQLPNPDIDQDEESLAGWDFRALYPYAPDAVLATARRRSGFNNVVALEIGPRCGGDLGGLPLCGLGRVPPFGVFFIGGAPERPVFASDAALWNVDAVAGAPVFEGSRVALAVGAGLVFGLTGGRVAAVWPAR